MKKILFIISFVSLSLNIYSQTTDSTVIKETSETLKQNDLAEIYKILYEQSQEETSDLQEIFQWSMGSIIVIILAIFGTNIFFNFRYNKKELESLMQQFDLKIQKNQEEFLEDNKKEQNKYKDKIDKNLKETEKEFQGLLKSFNENYTQQITNLNSNIDKQIETIQESFSKQLFLSKEVNKEIQSSIKKDISQKELRLKKLITEIKSDFNYNKLVMEQDVARVKANVWDGRGVYANSLTYRIKELELSIKLDYPLYFYLEDFISNLKKLTKLDIYDIKKINTLIDKISSKEYEGQIDEIRAIVKSFED